MKTIRCQIKEDSLIARLAAWKLGTKKVAIVLGRTIFLYNTSRTEFLNNRSWVRHELVHIRQFHDHGFFPFIIKYLFESIRNGYHRNKFELEARQGERILGLEHGIEITN